MQEKRELLDFRILSRKLGYMLWIVVRIGVTVIAGYVFYFLIAICRNWLNLQSKLIRPRKGLYPLIKDNGIFYDPNRALGEDPYITLSALKVQEAAASGKKTIVKTSVPTAPAQPRPAIQELPQLPTRIDLPQLLDRPTSLHRLPLGVTVDKHTNQVVTVHESLFNLVHVGIGGSSGYGKSLFLQCLAYELATAVEPVGLVLIDLERVTLLPFASSKRLLYPLASTHRDVAFVLQELSEQELNHRQELFTSAKTSSLAKYNVLCPEQPLIPIACLIDEGALLGDDSSLSTPLRTLALRGRKFGLFVICTSQDWKADLFDTSFTNQLSSRFQFGCRNKAQARVLMGEGGAEAFDASGRCVAQIRGQQTIIMQTPYVEEQWLENNLPTGTAIRELDAAFVPVGDVPIDVLDDPSKPDAERVAVLFDAGYPQSTIEERVFGHTGGNAWRRTKRILQARASVQDDKT